MSKGTNFYLIRMVESLGVLVRTRLWMQIVIAMVLGLTTGLLLSPEGAALVSLDLSAALASWFKLPGSIFLNMIQMVVIPLIMSSIILGLSGSGNVSQLKRVGLRIAPYFVVTTAVSVVIGIVLVQIIQPGDFIDESLLSVATELQAASAPQLMESKPLPERIAELIPANLNESIAMRNMLQLVVYAIFIGVAVILLPQRQRESAVYAFGIIQEVALKVVGWAMLFAPLAVFGLLADIAIRIGLTAILGMSVYVGTVILGLLILLSFYLIIVAFVASVGPITFLQRISGVQLLAFSTSSSAAVMPLSMRVAESPLGVKPSIAKFIVPLGATVNMDGTALYQVIAAVFLTQVYGIDLTTAQLIGLTVTTVGASIGSPSTPGVGIVILATILSGIGVPPEGIALIIGVDRILDMCRTAVNVTGDLTACLVMDKLLGSDRLEESGPQTA
ncbi:dicarboxylate/amino acid:cation symporter [Microbulbifer sp. OS29]|uniref:Dicarboxylate/amino acid:cation symporter n=1 Tax=Microbulbifer okhotskensis TaxID=2926617 RepID=A0A9X2ETG9_9GAMM|nr:dicarboxylate/amino acid:cation symporter [Microbulbifer okhotskensis]MCO1335483.1 dicarboxylate/amino acid:cation symporter [Microbulbifer okhotskensis]